MSGVFGALFSGQAARGTDESFQRWKQLFQADEQLDLQRKQLKQARDLQEDAQAHDLDLANAELTETLALKTWEGITQGTVNARDVVPFLGRLRESDNPLFAGFADMMESAGSQQLFKGRPQAAQYIQNVQTAIQNGEAVPYNDQFFSAAVDMMVAGLPEEQAEQLRESYGELGDFASGRIEELSDAAGQTIQQDLAKRAADIASVEQGTAESAARTEHLGAQTESVIANNEHFAEIRPFLREQEERRARALELANSRGEIELEFLPRQLTASLNESLERIRGMDNENDLAEAVFEDIVEQAHIETGLGREELRFALATASWQEALVENKLDTARQTLKILEAQEQQIITATERDRVGIDADKLALVETRLSMVNDLVQNGNPEMVRSLGADLLRNTGIADGDIPGIVDKLSEIAGRKRVSQMDLEEAQATIAVAQASVADRQVQAEVRSAEANADFAEWKASVAEAQREFDNDLAERGMRVQEGALEARRAEMELEGAPSSSPAGHKATRDALGYGMDSVMNRIKEYNNDADNLNRLQLVVNQGNPEEIQSLINEFGISAPNHEAATQALQDKLTSTEALLVSQIRAYANTYYTETGLVLTPNDLGFSDIDHPIYRQAISGLSFIQEGIEAAGELGNRRSSVLNLVDNIAIRADPAGTQMGGGRAAYDALLEAGHTEEELAEIGINGPLDIQPILQQRTEQWTIDRETANQGLQLVSNIYGREFSLDSRGDRTFAVQVLNSRASRASDLSNEIRNESRPLTPGDPSIPGLALFHESVGLTRDPLEQAQRIAQVTGQTVESLRQQGLLNFNGTVNPQRAAQYLDRFVALYATQAADILKFDR
jgi:hypothetical protein